MHREEIVSINPATKEELGTIPIATKDEIHQTVESARIAFSSWKKTTFKKRGSFLKNLAKEIQTNADSLARLITLEMGKPIIESKAEVERSISFLNYFAENTQKYMLPTKIEDIGSKDAKIIYEPRGVVAAIKAWNLPLATPISAIAPALMTGCTVVFKPSENTLFVGKEIETLAEKCMFPEGVFSILPGGKESGRILLQEKIDMVSFTGSIATGKSVANDTASRFIKTTLELGGKDPLLVFPDCNLDFAAMNTVWGSTTNCGQFCSSIERVYIHEDIYKPLVDKIVALTEKIKVGNGLNPETDMGPLVNQEQYNIVLNQVNDATDKGAKALVGGTPYEHGDLAKGYFFKPTVLVDVDHKMDIMKFETFGPIISIMSFKDVEEGITLANDSFYGLGASVITQNKNLAETVASNLDVGMVWVNGPLKSMAPCPWIVRKGSGLGYELGQLGIHEFSKPKLINSQFENNDQNREWWYPYKNKI